MKRIISLMLCLLMLVPMMASCSKDEELDTIETATRETVTLGMYVITEEGTTEEAAQAVEDAIKILVKSKYTTNLEIEFITADKYYDVVEDKLVAMKKGASSAPATEASSGDETEAVTTAATIINEYGVTELRYPELGENQIDLFMIADYDKFLQYVDAGHLYNLDDTVKNASKKLSDYIYPSILQSAQVKGSYYAIPNNKPVGGESTFMIIDKELAAEYKLDVKKITSFYDENLANFLNWVSENKTDVTPIAGAYDKLNATYMNYGDRAFVDEFSLVGTYGNGVISEAKDIFADGNYTGELLYIAELYYNGVFGDENAENFATAIKTGDISAMAEYSDDYEIVVLDSEAKPASELCSSMFAVSKYTTELPRVMEVITLLNTSSEIRNLLQYGIKNVNYELDEETGALRRMNNEYMMDIYKTGNVYMAYPEEGMPLNIWEMSKKQNLASGTYVSDVFGGFAVPENTPEELDPESGEVTKEAFTVDESAAKELAKASAELLNDLKSAATYEEFEALVKGASEKYADVIAAFLNTENANTPYALYKAQ